MIKPLLKFATVFFLFILFALPVGLSNATFTSTSTVFRNTFSTSCWVSPSVPELVYPSDNTYAGAGSNWDNNPHMDWQDSSSSCPLATTLSYQYQACSDPACTSVIYTSPTWLTDSQIPAPGTPDGVYYWRVRSRDNHSNTSNFSPTWKLTVDRTAPTVPSLSITGSYTKAVEEKLTNGNFLSGTDGWTTAGTVARLSSDTIADLGTVNPDQSSFMVRLGQDADPAPYLWQNRLMQSFGSGAKSLAINYNFFSRDSLPLDDPGFLVRLNGENIFSLSSGNVDSSTRSTGWQQFNYDLSDRNVDNLNLAIYSGNNGDQSVPSWAYVSRVTTYFVSAPLHATYTFAGDDNPGGSGLDHFAYSLDNSNWTTIGVGSSFSFPASGAFNLWYYAVDRADNRSSTLTVKILVDDVAPSASTLEARDLTPSSAVVSWLAPGNDADSGRAAKYDLRYSVSASGDCGSFDFNNSANQIAHLSAPQTAGSAEAFQLLGLNPDTLYCAQLKTADEAPNWSAESNRLSFTTTSAPIGINPGDIIINEIMWSGTNPDNQFLELRNMTDRVISLDGVILTKTVGGVETPMSISFSGQLIASQGYFLIAKSSAFFSSTVAPDINTDQLDLSASEFEIKLYSGSTVIDLAGDGSAPFEGTSTYSMERTTVPGPGNSPFNWYTCIDLPSNADFFSVADYRGTPRALNRSENEPVIQTVTPTPSPTGQPIPTFSISASYHQSTHKILIDLSNTPAIRPNYEVIYQSGGIEKGVAGTANTDHLEIYLGTCSTGGTCVSDGDFNTPATVKVGDLTQSINLQ